MEDQQQWLARIAAALERIAPPAPAPAEWLAAPAFTWSGDRVHPIAELEAPPLSLLKGIDRQKRAVTDNVARLAGGHAAHDMLLWGARGMGKSALVRAAVREAQATTPEHPGRRSGGGPIALVQVASDAMPRLAELFAALRDVERNFLVFCDDLGFAEGDSVGPRFLRSWLDGGVEARPANVRLAVTSNRRAIVARHAHEQDDPVNPRDVVDDQLALADRFGLSLGFHACSQDEYLEMLHAYAARFKLDLDETEALEWSRKRGARSGRMAWHYMTELAGREGRSLP